MPVRAFVAEDINDLTRRMNALGLDIGAVDQHSNESGRYYVLYNDTGAGDTIAPGAGAVGFSWAAGSGTLEVMQKSTDEAAEVVSAISGLSVTGTLGNTYVIPGTVSLTDSGGTGPAMADDLQGNIVEAGTLIKRGTIDYATGAIDITYLTAKAGTGNLLADYSHSDLPDSGDVPTHAILRNISVLAGGNVDIAIYEDEALTIPVFKGTIPVSGGSGFLDLGGLVSVTSETADMTKRDRRWITVSVAVTDLRLYWEQAIA